MNVAVTAEGQTLNDKVSSRFEGCGYVLIVSLPDMGVRAIAREADMTGEQLAGAVIDADCEALITGALSPEPFERLVKACITRYDGAGYSVGEALGLMENFGLKLIRNLEGTDDCDGDHHK